MLTIDIATNYKINRFEFEDFSKENNLEFEKKFMGISVKDELIDEYVQEYKMHLEKKEELQKEQAIEDMRKKKEMSEILITSGFQFEGYKITKYSGYISGDDVVTVECHCDSIWREATVKEDIMSSLVQIRRNALRELKEAAYNLGCNAVIGVDFDYLTLDSTKPEESRAIRNYVVGVTANGNAVVIEKVENN